MTQTALAPARRRGRPPSSDSAVTRERILAAAQLVFAESGYEAATFQAIAAEVGLTRPAINNYFSSKAELYAEVVGRVGEAVLDAVDRAGRMPNLSGQILTFVREALRDPDADSPVAAFLVQAAMDAHHVPASGGQAATLVEGFIRGAVGSAARRGEVGADPDGLTDMLLGLVWGTAFQLARGDVRSADRMLEQLCAVLGSGPER